MLMAEERRGERDAFEYQTWRLCMLPPNIIAVLYRDRASWYLWMDSVYFDEG